tara:strand:- start:10071 stop:11003 length:933 start_codon:yes stop_codon:yes gene_type:complete
LILEYENVVVGSSLSAVLYAFNNQYPLLFTKASRPFRFDYLEQGVDLSSLKIPRELNVLTTFQEKKEKGVRKEILWERLLFLLSLDGNVPLSNLCHSMRYDGEKITCSNEYSKIAEIGFDRCIYFEQEISGLDIKRKLADNRYMCYDWVAFHKGGKHEIDYFKTDDEFVSEVWFYPSDRIDGNTKIKDACIKSFIDNDSVNDFNFSETMARFKLVHEMESRGMKGKFNGYGKSGKARYYKHRTSSIFRQTCGVEYEYTSESSRIEIGEKNEQVLLQSLPASCVAYDRFLMNYEEHTLSRNNTGRESKVGI